MRASRLLTRRDPTDEFCHGSGTVVLVLIRFVSRRGVRRVWKWFRIRGESQKGG
jgi:hypothetical protein